MHRAGTGSFWGGGAPREHIVLGPPTTKDLELGGIDPPPTTKDLELGGVDPPPTTKVSGGGVK